MNAITTVKLNNGSMMPQLGLGVWQAKDGQEVESAVNHAITSGFRLIDTAAIYGNEAGVGRAIAAADVPREELFITTKLWNSEQGRKRVRPAFAQSLSRLGLDYVDLYLIHWPVPSKGLFVETWKELERLYREGLARAIGVSNFKPTHLEKLLAESEVVPAVNQIELHPHLVQSETRDFCAKHGIQVESYSPLGGSGGGLLSEPVLSDIGKKYDKTPAQVVLRWQVQQGLIVIPKSVRPERIKENAAIFDFNLSSHDMELIASLNVNQRVGADPDTANF